MDRYPLGFIESAHGLKVVDESVKRLDIDIDDLVREYLAGRSQKELSDSLGVSRPAIRRRLVERGIEVRDPSEAERTKWQRMNPEVRARQVAAAHAAARGRRRTDADLCQRALTRQERGLGISGLEKRLASMLEERGLATVAQEAIGRYNCDLGAFPVAVEIWGGNWHWYGRHIARTEERFRYVLDAGWHLLVLHVTNRHPLSEGLADYVVSYVEKARRDPAARREYRMVWRGGELTTAGRADDDEISVVPPFGGTRDRSTGRYATVPR